LNNRTPPRKRFGQNFLVDRSFVDKIVQVVQPGTDDHIVEIGPGKGALTGGLLAAAGRLVLIEIDRDLVELLREKFGSTIDIHCTDVLKFDMESLWQDRPIRIVGNLPYNISTPLLFRLMQWTELIKDMYFMLQREVVDRLASVPSTPAYGRLGIMAQYHCRIEKCFDVPPGAFNPAPRVQSAVVRLVPHECLPFPVADVAVLRSIVTTAFSQRRKTVRNALKSILDEETMEAAGVDPGLRPENISLELFAGLTNIVMQTSGEKP
jgi:16S rRNA (adenine1518-N6/adenine1519-N6)-dimethyltransferase